MMNSENAIAIWAASARRLRLISMLVIACFVPMLLLADDNRHVADDIRHVADNNRHLADNNRHFHVLDFESGIFENIRKIRVLLPSDYYDEGSSEKRYPTLYLNDGQNLFDAETAVLGAEEWQVDETVRRLIAARELPQIIVVGIDNAGRRDRPYEYLPYPDVFLQPPVPEPQGRLYPAFLEEEVIPFVEKRYRVQLGAGSRVLGGSSYGALVTLHTAIARPRLFSRLLLESPSFYVDEDHVLRDARITEMHLDRVYLGVGTNELGLDGCPDHPGNTEAVNGVHKLARILKNHGMGESQVRVEITKCAQHSESAWAERFPDAIRFLFEP